VDYGCGNGVVSDALIGYGYRVSGYDVGRTKPGGKFTAALCFDVIEHAAEREDPVADIRGMLVDGSRPLGLLLLTAPNKWWLFETHARPPFNRLPFFNWGPWAGWLRRKVGRNVPSYTKGQIRELLESRGFVIIDIGYMTAPMDRCPPLRKLVWNHHTTRIPFAAVEIYAVAVKR